MLTAVTQPDVRISHQAIFQTPLGPDHFLSGKGLVAVRQFTNHGAGGALKTLFQVFAAFRQNLLEEFPVGF
jgi:hypothetical protein